LWPSESAGVGSLILNFDRFLASGPTQSAWSLTKWAPKPPSGGGKMTCGERKARHMALMPNL
jgi:hypothetical protein